MPRPRGLEFVDRLAAYKNGFFFLCQKVGHKPRQAFVRGSIRDAQKVREAHDTVYHNEFFRQTGIRSESNLRIDDLVTEWVAHIERLVEQKKRSKKTLRHYRYMGEILKKVFSSRESLAGLMPDRISRAALDLKQELETEGQAVVKALGALRTMLAWKGIPTPWKIPLDEIDPQRQPKRDLTMEQILWLIQHTPAGSVEEAAIALKMRTGMREVEIAAANVGDFDPRDKLIAPALRSKSRRGVSGRRHVYALSEDVVELLIPFTVERAPDEPLLPIGGERLKETSLRRRLVTASKAANAELHIQLADGQITEEEYKRKLIDPPLRGLKPIRAEVATLVADEISMKDATDWIGHKDESTIERWYYKNRVTAAQLEQKRKIAEVLRRLAPLPAREHAPEHAPGPNLTPNDHVPSDEARNQKAP